MKSRGFVLINALVLVATLAAIATLLLSRAEGGRTRLASVQTAAQLTLHLDAFEAMARTLLTNSVDDGPDHLGSAWAQRTYDLPLEAGHITGEMRDLHGKFNINWLNASGNAPAQAAFARLLKRLGISPAVHEAILAYLRPGGPSNKAPFRALNPPQDPVGGSLLMISQLNNLPGLSDDTRARLLPHLTALPGDSTLNPNTATPEVLAAFLPELSIARLERVLSQRTRQPFEDRQAFLREVGLARDEDAEPAENEGSNLTEAQISVQSDWFEIRATAELGELSAARVAVIRRGAPPAQAETYWRITTRP